MSRRVAGPLRIVALAAACGALHSASCPAQVVVRVNDGVFFQLGTQLQFWGDSTQDQLGGRLEYRGGVFSGSRQPATASAAGSRNTPQYAARVQYDVFDPEKGYTYAGTNRGAKKILAFGAWGNGQGRFRSWGADVTADIPLADKSAVTVGAQYYFYDGRGEFTQTTAGTTTDLLPK